MIVAENGVSRRERGKEAQREGDWRARQLVAIWRKDKVLAKLDACTGQELPAEKVPENRRNMCRLASLVHRAQFPGQEELETRRQRIDVRSSEDADTARGEKPSHVPQKADGALNVFYHLDCRHQVKRRRPQQS